MCAVLFSAPAVAAELQVIRQHLWIPQASVKKQKNRRFRVIYFRTREDSFIWSSGFVFASNCMDSGAQSVRNPFKYIEFVLFRFKLTHDMNYNMIVPIRQVAAAMNTAIFTDFVSFNKWRHNPLILSVIIHNSFTLQKSKPPDSVCWKCNKCDHLYW